ncbi:replication initiator protein A [Streptococcus uberis]|uniref:replication initiator protein A n=1 Tax=Streptococcus uberis TaxID=1349 RepID=UPI003D77602E
MKLISANEYQTSERFYALPKILFESDFYKEMRLDAKVSYAFLKDRLSLSLKNNWIDEEGYIFLVYSNANLMDILNVSKSTLLRIKKELVKFGLIHEVQQSNSKSGNLANRIYLGQLRDDKTSRTLGNTEKISNDTRGVSNLYQGGVKFIPGGCQKNTRGCQDDTGMVSNLAPNETEYSETEYSKTEYSKTCLEDDEENKIQNSQKINKEPILSKKVENVTRYDRDYIWQLVYVHLLKENLTQKNAEVLMIQFDQRYQYALENMKYIHSSEQIAEYVFNGLLAQWNLKLRKHQERIAE